MADPPNTRAVSPTKLVADPPGWTSGRSSAQGDPRRRSHPRRARLVL